MIAKRSIIPVFVPHYGCPNDCVFCNQRKISGQRCAPTGVQLGRIVAEGLSKCPQKQNIQLAFYGGSFTAIPLKEQTELLEGALPFLRDGCISSLRVSTRPDAIDEEVLERLKKYGVSTIELGAQSMDEEVLILSGRGHTCEQTRHAARLIKQTGFELILQMMTGLPGDTLEKTLETARKIIVLEPDGVRIYPTVVIRDTRLWDMWQKGEYLPHTTEKAVEWCARLLPMFEAAGISVIRLGLNPSEELSGGDAAAGAYHPAFGELVMSRILLERARQLLSGEKHGQQVVLGVNKAQVSAMVGQKRENVQILCREFGLDELKIRSAELPKGSVILL